MKRIIAIVGMSGSGKGVASTYLEEKGYQKVYFGGVIYDKMKEEGILITPNSQKEFREKIRKEYGMGAIAKILLPKIEKLYQNENVVLDGLYSWTEYKILKEKFPSLKLIGIVVDKQIRYQRVENRVERAFHHDEIVQRDLSEIENIEKGGPIAYADYYVFNNGDFSSYQKRLDGILEEIEKEY